jgi:hypothetical protein
MDEILKAFRHSGLRAEEFHLSNAFPFRQSILEQVRGQAHTFGFFVKSVGLSPLKLSMDVLSQNYSHRKRF